MLPLVHFVRHGAAEQRAAGPRMAAALRRNPEYARPGGAIDFARDERDSYGAWLRTARHVPPAARAAALAPLPSRPLVSLLCAVGAGPLDGTLRALQAQAYDRWELCAVAAPDADSALHALAAAEPRLRLLPAPGPDGAALQAALDAARGDCAGVLEPGDRLHPLALATLLRPLLDGHDAVYADEDRITDAVLHADPVFRPAPSPELLLADEAVARAGLVRTALLRGAGGFRPGCGGAAAFDLALRVLPSLAPGRVAQVPHPLFHRTGPQPDRRADAAEAVRRVVPGAKARPEGGTGLAVVFTPRDRPLVSAVITGPNATVPGPLGPEWLLGACLHGLRHGTDWPALEILVAHGGPFTPEQAAALDAAGARVVAGGANAAAAGSDGAFVLLVDEGITPKRPGWLAALVGAAGRPGVGVAGARLFFPDGRLRHTGLVLQDGLPARPFFAADGDVPGAAGMPHALRACLAVSGACQLLPRAAWDAGGGHDGTLAARLAGADLCLRLGAKGLRTVYVPEASLFHASPLSPPVTDAEAAPFRARWGTAADPFYPSALPTHPSLGTRGIADGRGTPGEARPYPAAALERSWTEGINWLGPVDRASGLGTAARGYVAACAATGLPVRAVPLDRIFAHQAAVPGPPPGPVQDFPVTVFHVNADLSPGLPALYPDAFVGSRHRIGFWVWELPDAQPEWAAAARLFDEIWTPSAFCTAAFRAVTDRPVLTVPHALLPRPLPDRAAARAWLQAACGVPPGAFVALYMLDAHSVVARKNPAALLDAFGAEFGDDPGTVLVLKVSNLGHLARSAWPEDRALLARLRHLPPNVRLVSTVLADEALQRLLGAADCYVSPHRSEGFGLTVAEAMQLGLPVIATDFGATTEFVRPGTGLPLEYGLVPLAADRGPYRAGQLWAEPSVPHLRALLRQLAGDPDGRAALGEAGRALVTRRFSLEAVGRVVRQRLARIAAARRPGG